MIRKSIFKFIESNLDSEGRLPIGFLLSNDTRLQSQINQEELEEIAVKITEILEREFEHKARLIEFILPELHAKPKKAAERRIKKLLHKCGTLSVVEFVFNSLSREGQFINTGKVMDYACCWAFKSDDPEFVKLGIALLGLLNLTKWTDITRKLSILALCDEFTLYAAITLSSSHNGNELLFEILKKIRDWGKIQAADCLIPETAEMKDWLLRHGCEDVAEGTYIGLICAKKGDLIRALRKNDMDDGLFDGICAIIGALAKNGMNDYEHREEAVKLFLEIAERRSVSVKHLVCLQSLRKRLEESNNELLKSCNDIIERDSWQELIFDTFDNRDEEQFYFAIRAAEESKIEIGNKLMAVIKSDPIKYGRYAGVLYDVRGYATELTSLYEKILPLDKMERGEEKEGLLNEHICMRVALSGLGRYPNLGERLVNAALHSKLLVERYFACNVLDEWIVQAGLPIKQISPELYETVRRVRYKETDAELRKRMERLGS